MASHPQLMAPHQIHNNFSRSPGDMMDHGGDSSSSDTPGGGPRRAFGYSGISGMGGRLGKRGSIDYSSATDVEVGYSSTASNSTFIPTYGGTGYAHQQPQQYITSPTTLYEPRQPGLPLSPQQSQQQAGAGNVQSPTGERYTSPGGTVHTNPGANNTPASAAANSSAAATYRRSTPATPPVPLACTECRLRHLKCDAGTPSCGRCRAEGRICCYVKSRRGWKGRKRKGSTVSAAGIGAAVGSGVMSATSGAETSANEKGIMSGGEGPGSYSGIPRISAQYITSHTASIKQQSPAYTNPLETLRAYHKNSTTFHAQHEHIPHNPAASLIQLYYAYFHSSHPFMLPPAYLVKTHAAKLTHLMPVVRYIGSFFAPNAPRDSFRDAAEYTLFRQNAPRNGFTVQAMLLFSIGLHASNEQEKSAQVKDVAVDIALEIGMNREEFAYFGGEKIPDDVLMTDDAGGGMDDGLDEKRQSQDPVDRVMQESWRRTWWELYFLDGMLAGVHQRVDGFRLWMVDCSVPLPCEESEYNNGRIPDPKSLHDFDDRTFSDEPITFSSYAYRVEAIRILGQVLHCSRPLPPQSPPPGSSNAATTTSHEDAINDGLADAADASLVNWALHLPEDKKELVGKDRKVDEMLFQAHMIVYATSIYLHRPRSHLVVSLVSDETACTPQTGYTASHHPILFHTSKAVHAANAISKLVTLPTPLIKHSPFFTCVLTLATIVHLSACSWLLAGDEGYLAKERIRLGIGALKTMEMVWGVAGCVLGQVRGAAREVFRYQRQEMAAGGSGGLSGMVSTGVITEEEIMRYIEEEGALEGDVAILGMGDVELAEAAAVGEAEGLGAVQVGVDWDGS